MYLSDRLLQHGLRRRQGFLKQAHEVNKLKRFPYEALHPQPRKRAIDSFSAVGAGKYNSDIWARVLGFLEDIATGHAR